MKKFALLSVAFFAAVLTSSCQSTRQQQSASVYAPGAGDIVVNMNGQQEARKKSPGNTAQVSSQRRDEVVRAGGPPPVRHSSNSGSNSGYRGTLGYRPAGSPAPTRYVTGYHVERIWEGGGNITIPPGAQPIATGVARHWEGWGTGPDGSREGVIIEHHGYRGPHVPWGAPSSSSSTTVNRFGYGN